MKRFFEVLGMCALITFTFFYTSKATTVVKEMDDIMVRIEKEKVNYELQGTNAKVDHDTVIPGLYGKTVDEQKSYEKMKRYGSFNPNLFVYHSSKPEVVLKNNRDKYIIGGNPMKQMTTLVFIVENNDSIEPILKILEEKQVKASFFLDGTWFETHNDDILKIVKEGHDIGNLSYHKDYTNSNFIWMNTMIKKVAKQKMNFCYTEVENKEALNICNLQKNYTVKPNILVKQKPFAEVKNTLSAGNIIAFPINQTVITELPVTIDYIKSKGFQITTLNEHLSEE